MKRGEKVFFVLMVLLVLAAFVRSQFQTIGKHDEEIPYYSTSNPELTRKAMDIYHGNGCKSCHSLWTLSDMTQSVPAPMLDGIGSLRTESWLFEYLSAPNPQAILPSRLKSEYRMPSFGKLPEEDRRILASYLAGLKVKDWYLEQTRKAEYEKLTGLEAKK